MSYVACPGCGQINRSQDAQCFSCQADLTAVPPPPPPEEVAPPPPNPEDNPDFFVDKRVTRIAAKDADAGRFKDLSSRYESKPVPKTDADVLSGVRSGIAGGLICGLVFGAFRLKVPDDFTRLLIKKYATIGQQPGQILIFSIGTDLICGVLLGMILGFTNILCFPPESGRTGAIFGGLAGALLIYLTKGTPFTLGLGAFHGFVMGTLIALFERKVFRGISG